MPDLKSPELSISEVIKRKITIDTSWERLGFPGDSAHGNIFLDRGNKRVYRQMDLNRDVKDHGKEIADFWGKVRVGMYDKSGLIPKVYSFDPDSFTLEMEWIEGKRLDELKRNEISVQQAQQLYRDLASFHKAPLYHADLYSLKNYKLDSSGRIRLLDPTYVEHGTSYWLSTLGLQEQDHEQVIATLRRNFNLSRANVTGEFLNLSGAREGNFLDSVDDEVLYYKRSCIGHVFQHGMGMSNGDESDGSPRFLETDGVGSCITIALHAPDSSQTCLIHADMTMNIKEVINQASIYLESTRVEVSVVGGKTDSSELLLKEINDTLALQKGWQLVRQDTLAHRENIQVIVDTWYGNFYRLYQENRTNLLLKQPWETQSEEFVLRQMAINRTDTSYIIDNFYGRSEYYYAIPHAKKTNT